MPVSIFCYNELLYKEGPWCCRSSVDSSAPSILSPWVRIPGTPSMLLWHVEKTTRIWAEKGRNRPIFLKKRRSLFFNRCLWFESVKWTFKALSMYVCNLESSQTRLTAFWLFRTAPFHRTKITRMFLVFASSRYALRSVISVPELSGASTKPYWSHLGVLLPSTRTQIPME